MQLPFGWLNIAPELRFTRWAADPVQPSRTEPNQTEILVGLTTRNETAVREAFVGHLSIGAIAGTNLANDYRAGAPFTTEYPGISITSEFHSGPRSVTGGPVVEVHAGAVSFEASFLRRVLHGIVDDRVSNGISQSSPSTVGVWEISVLAKYRIGGGPGSTLEAARGGRPGFPPGLVPAALWRGCWGWCGEAGSTAEDRTRIAVHALARVHWIATERKRDAPGSTVLVRRRSCSRRIATGDKIAGDTGDY